MHFSMDGAATMYQRTMGPNFKLRYFTRLKLKKLGSLQFCLSVFLGIYRNPKQKEIFNSYEEFLK